MASRPTAAGSLVRLALVVVLFASGEADITGTSPSSGSCLCYNANGVNVRASACGTVLGTANKGDCFTYGGGKGQRCTLQGTSYEFFRIGSGWSAGGFLDLASKSRCPSGGFTDKCLNCICKVESNCNRKIGCHWDVSSDSCGPYQIKEDYWKDCGKPGSSWRSCANDITCAATCVRNYMKRYGTYCTRGSTPTCEDYARIHNGGPAGCRSSATVGYWNRVKQCCGSQTGCD